MSSGNQAQVGQGGESVCTCPCVGLWWLLQLRGKQRKRGVLGAGLRARHAQRLTVPAAGPGPTRMLTCPWRAPPSPPSWQMKASEESFGPPLEAELAPGSRGLRASQPGKELEARPADLFSSSASSLSTCLSCLSHIMSSFILRNKTCIPNTLSLTMSRPASTSSAPVCYPTPCSPSSVSPLG